MAIFEMIIEFLASFFEVYMANYFITKLLGNRLLAKHSFGLLLGVSVFEMTVIDVCNHLFHIPHFDAYVICMMIGISFTYALLFLRGSLLKKLGITFVPHVLIGIISFVIPYLVSLLTGIHQHDLINEFSVFRIITLFLTKILLFFILFFLLRIQDKDQTAYSRPQWFALILMQFFTIAIFILMFMGVNGMEGSTVNRFFFILACSGIVSTNLIFYFLINRINHANQMETRYLLSLRQLEYQKEHVENVKQKHQEIRRIKHDMKNHLLALDILVRENKNDEALQYLEDLIEKKLASSTIIRTGNDIIDAILNAKITVCNQLGIHVICATTSHLKELSGIDIAALLANLFDNAIEACQRSGENNICLMMSIKRSYLSVIMKNQIQESVLEHNPDLCTSKKDSFLHGFGTKSIKHIVEEHQGMVKFYEESDMFICDILLKLDTL